MRKPLLALSLIMLLSGCGDDGIYGNYVNPQYGVRLDIHKMKSSSKMVYLLLRAGTKVKSQRISQKHKIKSSVLGHLGLRR